VIGGVTGCSRTEKGWKGAGGALAIQVATLKHIDANGVKMTPIGKRRGFQT